MSEGLPKCDKNTCVNNHKGRCLSLRTAFTINCPFFKTTAQAYAEIQESQRRILELPPGKQRRIELRYGKMEVLSDVLP